MITDQQRKERMTGIGGSDAPIVAGMHPYRQPYDLWLEKTGQAEPENLDDKDVVHFGNVLEPVCAEEYMRRTGNKVRRVNTTLRHPDRRRQRVPMETRRSDWRDIAP